MPSVNPSAATAYNRSRNYGAGAIRIIQRETGSQVSGAFDPQSATAIHRWQGESRRMASLVRDGKMGPKSLGVMIGELVRRGGAADATVLAGHPHILPPGATPPPGATTDPILEFRAITVTPINLRAFGAGFMMGGSFKIRLKFHPDVDCRRYEYRQRIKGTATLQQGSFSGTVRTLATWSSTGSVKNVASAFQIPGGLPTTFAEDAQITSTGAVNRFGHRSSSAVHQTGLEDRYLPRQSDGCEYRAQDTYGLRGTTRPLGLRIRLNIIWQGRVIDTRSGNRVIRTLHWGAKRDDIITV
jgi:hypothetical protein